LCFSIFKVDPSMAQFKNSSWRQQAGYFTEPIIPRYGMTV
jgi:hypothetical protein